MDRTGRSGSKLEEPVNEVVLRERKTFTYVALFTSSVVISNVLAAKVVNVGGFVFPASVLSYTLTFLIVNIMSSTVDKTSSRNLVQIGFLAQIFASGLVALGLILPADSPENQKAYQIILGFNWRFTLASMVAYFASQYVNLTIFNSMIGRSSKNSSKELLSGNFVAVAVAQLVDTAVFTFVGFLGQHPRLWNLIFSQYLLKLFIVALLSPLVLLGRRREK